MKFHHNFVNDVFQWQVFCRMICILSTECSLNPLQPTPTFRAPNYLHVCSRPKFRFIYFFWFCQFQEKLKVYFRTLRATGYNWHDYHHRLKLKNHYFAESLLFYWQRNIFIHLLLCFNLRSVSLERLYIERQSIHSKLKPLLTIHIPT